MLDKPTPYPELNAVLAELVAGIRSALGNSFVGAWLQGSFAIGDFDRDSDADFVVAVRDELSDAEVDALQLLHERVYNLDAEWAKHLEGSYFPLAILRDYDRDATPRWYLDHGSSSLIRSTHCNTLVVRWIVRERGVTLAGPAASTLMDPIPPDALRREVIDTIRWWGAQILANPDEYRSRFYQGFVVLNYPRMLHDLAEGHPGSKRAGAEWAKRALGAEWSGLIDRAWATRPDPAVSARTPADPADFEATLRLVRVVLRECERYAVQS
jgi:predicted nucleotidyltransferase